MMPLSIYVAAPKACVALASDLADELSVLEGVRVVSTWHRRVTADAQDPTERAEAEHVLALNMRDFARADVIVVITAEGVGRETYVELGRALGRGLRVCWVTEHGGLALSHVDPEVAEVETTADAIAWVRALRRAA